MTLWGLFDNEPSVTYVNITPAVTFSTVFIAFASDYVQTVVTGTNDLNLAAWNRGYTGTAIRFLIQNPKNVSDAYSYFAICK